MSETKHTTGPWSACKGGDCQCGMIWDATGNALVAVVQGATEHLRPDGHGPDCTPTDDAQKANARLIAAAPDLLAVAKEAFQYSPFHTSDCGVTEYEEGVIFDTTKGCTCFLSRLRAAIVKAEGTQQE